MIQSCIFKIITFFLIIFKFKPNSRRLFGIFKIKILWIGLFLAFPPMAAWALRGQDEGPTPQPAAMTNTVETSRVQMPVEVIAKGGKAEWVMVEVPAEAIPEPGTTTLLMTLSCLLLLRRKREE